MSAPEQSCNYEAFNKLAKTQDHHRRRRLRRRDDLIRAGFGIGKGRLPWPARPTSRKMFRQNPSPGARPPDRKRRLGQQREEKPSPQSQVGCHPGGAKVRARNSTESKDPLSLSEAGLMWGARAPLRAAAPLQFQQRASNKRRKKKFPRSL